MKLAINFTCKIVFCSFYPNSSIYNIWLSNRQQRMPPASQYHPRQRPFHTSEGHQFITQPKRKHNQLIRVSTSFVKLCTCEIKYVGLCASVNEMKNLIIKRHLLFLFSIFSNHKQGRKERRAQKFFFLIWRPALQVNLVTSSE